MYHHPTVTSLPVTGTSLNLVHIVLYRPPSQVYDAYSHNYMACLMKRDLDGDRSQLYKEFKNYYGLYVLFLLEH